MARPASRMAFLIIVPEMEERRAMMPLVAKVLASLAVYGGIIRLAACPKRFCGWQFMQLEQIIVRQPATVQPVSYLVLQPCVHNGNPQDTSDIVCIMGVVYGCS